MRGMVIGEGGRSSGVLLYYPLRWGSLPKYVHVNGSGKLHLYTAFGNIVGTPNIVSRYCLQSVATVIEFCYRTGFFNVNTLHRLGAREKKVLVAGEVC